MIEVKDYFNCAVTIDGQECGSLIVTSIHLHECTAPCPATLPQCNELHGGTAMGRGGLDPSIFG